MIKKVIIVLSLILLTLLGLIIFKKEPEKIEKKDSIEFVFNDEYFGRKKEPKKLVLNSSIFKDKQVIEPEIVSLPKEPEPEVKRPLRPTGTFSSNVVTYSKSDPDIGLLADKENPTVIASKQYDLSRVVTTNKYIPAVLETAINSEIAGNTVTAIVESDVYGFAPKKVLIPEGSRIEGAFEALEKHSRKMQIAWFKITTPKGRIIKLDSSSIDSHGATGLKGDLDQRLKDRYGGALFLSALSAMANLSVDIESTRQLAIVDSITRQIIPLTNQAVKENLDVLPVIQIRKGQRFNIISHKNILFKKEDSFWAS